MAHSRNQTPPPGANPAAAGDDWMSLPQAAAALGKHRQTVEKLARQGHLVADDRAGRTFITRQSVDAYNAAAGDTNAVAAA